MTLTLTYHDGTSITLRAVEAVRLVAVDVVEVKTFGNEPALNRGIAAVALTYKPAAPFTACNQCGHPEGRHLHTNLGHVTRCYDCGCAVRFTVTVARFTDVDEKGGA